MLLTRGKRSGLVLLDGDAPSDELLRACIDQCDLFICADGAANRELPRDPDAVVGDLDSLAKVKESLPLIRMDDPDRTDGEKALLHLDRQGCDRMILLGGTGGRQDHHLVNLSLPLTKPGEVMLLGDDFAAVGIWDRGRFEIPADRGLSIFPLYGSVQGVCLRGVAYPLENADLAFPRGLTASNRSLDSRVEVEVLRGRLLLIVERQAGDALWQEHS